ncbi:oxo-acid lyase [Bacillaceae bacterium SIJ1]|uniref:2-dehydro-3-deoxy-phosphogluconate aldolase n=1 Tax=Litoribacterium kuwaitense TaxID=1398745 RepID=UPI0013EAE057|nr:KDGP aldolase [Litoribacterium kuwaitense]NGP46906.1 oxo-acid lyase [Litoribacterium kuwaitense]
MEMEKRFYRGRVCLNVLASSVGNAKEVMTAAEGYAVIGVLSKDYPTVGTAIEAMKAYDDAVEGGVSIGLGAGDYRQAAVVADIVRTYPGSHVNQVFSFVGATRANVNNQDSWINALVSPTGQPGYVNVSTGPMSTAVKEQAIIPVEAAIALVKEMGGNALKFFPMGGLACEAEYLAVAKACADADFALEPTGGIDLQNVERILNIALEARVPKIIPHVYSSIMEKQTRNTRREDVASLFKITKQVVDHNG